MKKTLLIVGLVALALAASALASGPTNRRQATAAAQQIMAAFQLPPGAAAAPSDPSSGQLGAPGFTVDTPDLVDLPAWWTVPGDPGAVFSWIEQHPPSGSKETTRGIGGNPARWVAGFSFGRHDVQAPTETLVVQVVSDGNGGTAVRADAEVVWLLLRPRSEKVPPGTRMVILNAPGKRLTITSAPVVAKIVQLVNRLPAAQPGAVSCPADRGPLVRLTFLRSPASPPLAVAIADDSGCGLVRFTLRGRREPPLAHGPQLIGRLEGLLNRSRG